MRKLCGKLIVLVLVLALLLSGCSLLDSVREKFAQLMTGVSRTSFTDMTYTRPNIQKLEAMAKDCEEAAATAQKAALLAEQVWEFYGYYNEFFTNYNLASIHHYRDVTDIYWEQEYNFCMEKASKLEAALDNLHHALAKSPLREQLEAEDLFGEGYFDDYEGESLWDPTFTAMMEEEARLISQYNDLSGNMPESYWDMQAYYDTYAPQMLEVFAQLVALRQEIGEYAGYDDYVQFAYDFYYYRDYTPQQAEKYCAEIRDTLVPLYRQLNDSNFWATIGDTCTEEQTYSYVRDMAASMGGTVKDAFQLMEALELSDTTYSPNKYNISFEVFLTSYGVPYLFVNPAGWDRDKLTFAHEFGHFCSDYAAGGSQAGVDVAEVFSQGMEYLSLCYGQQDKTLEKLKMADSLCIYVEQAAYAAFEQKLYSLKGDDLTPEGICTLFEKTLGEYGFDAQNYDPRGVVDIVHFFLYPQYVISYVVSNDAALQLYQKEQAQGGNGLKIFEESLATEQGYFLAFLEEAGLDSPFAPGRMETVKKTLSSVLN
ncbi:MAG: hypothetical protein J6Q30_00140 [Oscillospiraceae bacterium]|nr:hypothetical protein [Oscillospiraceae bacterium]